MTLHDDRLPPELRPAAELLSPASGWPSAVWQVPYNAAAIPGCSEPPSWLLGANCQRFAYGVLSLFGRHCPPFRSAELWADRRATSVVSGSPDPLDLALFHRTEEAFGAHVGLVLGPGIVLHLSRELGLPTVWPIERFASCARYATLIGFKRVKQGPIPEPKRR